jgi:hypothetical protein
MVADGEWFEHKINIQLRQPNFGSVANIFATHLFALSLRPSAPAFRSAFGEGGSLR